MCRSSRLLGPAALCLAIWHGAPSQCYLSGRSLRQRSAAPSATQHLRALAEADIGRQKDEDEELQLCRQVLFLPGDGKTAALLELHYWAAHGSEHAQLALLGMIWSGARQDAALAFRYLQRAWAFAPNTWSGNQLDQAQKLQLMGQFTEAETLFGQVIEAFPHWAQAYRMRAKLWNQLKDGKKTAGDLRTALKLNPIHYSVMVELALVLLRKGDYAEALRLLDRAGGLNPLLPGLDGFRKQALEQAPQLQHESDSSRQAQNLPRENPESVPSHLLPAAWSQNKTAPEDTGQKATSEFFLLGVEIERWLLDLRQAVSEDLRLSLVRSLARSWEDASRPGDALAPLAGKTCRFLKIYLAAEENLEISDPSAAEFLRERREARQSGAA